jgi:hypothetical protein
MDRELRLSIAHLLSPSSANVFGRSLFAIEFFDDELSRSYVMF